MAMYVQKLDKFLSLCYTICVNDYVKRVTPEEAEIKGLRKQLEKVRQERDILKKALAVFSKQSS